MHITHAGCATNHFDIYCRFEWLASQLKNVLLVAMLFDALKLKLVCSTRNENIT